MPTKHTNYAQFISYSTKAAKNMILIESGDNQALQAHVAAGATSH